MARAAKKHSSKKHATETAHDARDELIKSAKDQIVQAEMYARYAQKACDELDELFTLETEHKLGAIEALIEKSRRLMSAAMDEMESLAISPEKA
jgi:hypothetical protein